MREIEFRGKRESGGWGFGDLVGVTEHDGDAYHIVEKDGKITNGDKRTLIRVIPATVGQYTGLKDKNGKKVYEGDRVAIRWNDDGEDKEPLIRKITIKDEYGICCWFGGDQLSNSETYLDGTTLEVVNNIHDNPELKKVKMTIEIKNQITKNYGFNGEVNNAEF